jgi:hypothetical protein
MNQHQQYVIEYLREKNRVLRSQNLCGRRINELALQVTTRYNLFPSGLNPGVRTQTTL